MVDCKWCGLAEGDTLIEGALVCEPCHDKANWAVQHPQLCKSCLSLFTSSKTLQELLSDEGHIHGSNWETSAERGCPLCRVFLLQDPNSDINRNSTLSSLRVETRKDSQNGAADVTSLYFTSESGQFKLTLSVSAAADDPAAQYISQRPIPSNLANEETFSRGRSWLNGCLSTHVDTRFSRAKPRLPTRVIDVGNTGDEEVRLFEPMLPTREDYITLSYCWGPPPFLTTTLANLENHKNAIPMLELPQTIYDAVIVTRGMGIRYIWIDALCIIQDSPEDKVKELQVMGDIYHHSTLTVVAVSASAVAEGFLRPKPRPIVELPYLCPDGSPGTVQLARQPMISLWNETIYTRGWCLQEYLLSGRLLLFTDSEVLWSCQDEPFIQSENTHVLYDASYPTHSRYPFRRLPGSIFLAERHAAAVVHDQVEPEGKSALERQRLEQHISKLGLDIQPEEKLDGKALEDFIVWTTIVLNYSNRRLTYAFDRLPALAGVAERFQNAWPDQQYLAGLWSSHFIEQLSWHHSSYTQGESLHRPPSCGSPSWSWASVEGPIGFEFKWGIQPGKTRIPGAELISSVIEPLEKSFPLGNVRSGHAILEAQMVLASTTSMVKIHVSDMGRLYWDELPVGVTLNEFEGKEQCWCVLLGEARNGVVKKGGPSTAVAMIVVPVDGEEDTFRRVGLYTHSTKKSTKPWTGTGNRRRIKII